MLLNCGAGEDSRVPWTARRSNQSILKEISPGCSLEGLTLKLKLQYFDHLMQRADSSEKTLMLRGTGGRRRRGNRGWQSWMASPTRWTWVWVNSRSWWRTGRSGVHVHVHVHVCGSCPQRVGHDWAAALTDGTFLERQLCREPGFLSLLGSLGLTFPGSRGIRAAHLPWVPADGCSSPPGCLLSFILQECFL